MTSAGGLAPRAGPLTRLFYGFGSIAFGVKDNGFQTFLLLFYNQVVGLRPELSGLAILIALAADAVLDPIIGQFSDGLRTPWGRRHPLMYATALPLGAAYLLLWRPPFDASEAGKFWYLVATAIGVRSLISLYEAPSSALAPELTVDYAERTSLLGLRVFFAWLGGLAMYFLAFAVLLKPQAGHAVGQLNAEGYARYGLIAGVVMTISILVSALGTHRLIPTFSKPEKRPGGGLRRYVSEMAETLRHGSFAVLLASNLFSAMATGVAFSMNLYFYTYVWRLSTAQISIFAVVNLLAAGLGVMIARAASGEDKKRSAIVLFLAGLAIVSAPLVGRLSGVFPENGSPWLFPLLVGFSLVGLSPMIATSILTNSMIADLVEDSQLRTGRRSEGLFFASSAFVSKAVSGFGVLISGLILAGAGFPAKAGTALDPRAVDPEVLRRLILLYLPVVSGLYVVAMVCLLGYRIDRRAHEANLARLAASGQLPIIPEA